jgi:hypothetical protein
MARVRWSSLLFSQWTVKGPPGSSSSPPHREEMEGSRGISGIKTFKDLPSGLWVEIGNYKACNYNISIECHLNIPEINVICRYEYKMSKMCESKGKLQTILFNSR